MDARTAIPSKPQSDNGHGGGREGAGWYDADERIPRSVREKLMRARIKKEEGLARKAQLDAKEREGKLISRAAAAEQGRRAGIAIRDAMLSIPPRICHALAELGGDADAIERLLAAELRLELRRLAELLPKDAST